MKRYFSHMVTTLLAGACLVAASCSKSDEGPKIPEPNFPDAVSQSVEAGGTYTLNIEPNQDWEVSVPTATYQWFWIQDGSQKVSSKIGSAGKAQIVIGISEQEEFDQNRVCEVTLKMGGQSKVILTLTRGTLERSLSIRTCVIDANGDFTYDPDSETSGLSYLYQADPATNVSLLWPEGRMGFMMPVLVEGNFSWAVNKMPAWVTSHVTVGNAGERIELLLMGNAPAYPLDGADDKLVFIDTDNHDKSFEIGITIPPCRDIFKISDFEAVSRFNARAEYYNSKTSSWVPGSAMGSIMGIDGSKIYVFSEVKQQYGEPYLTGDAEDIAWITVTEEPWDETSEGGVVQTRKVLVGVSANSGDARKGVMVALPASEAAKITGPDDIIDAAEVREQYKPYIVTTIEQEATPGAIEAAEPDYMTEAGAAFVKLASGAWPVTDYQVTDGYQLTYTKADSWQKSYLTFNREYTDYAVYGYDGPQEPLDKDNCWITVEKSSKGVVIRMAPEKYAKEAKESFVVFSDAAGSYAMVYCIYDPDADIGGGGDDFEVKFASANVSGAVLEAITQDNYKQIAAQYGFAESDFKENLEMNIVQYVLIYTVANPANAELEVTSTQNMMVMPWGLEWLDYEPLSDTRLLISMTRPGAEDPATGMVQFLKGEGFRCIIHCKPTF